MPKFVSHVATAAAVPGGGPAAGRVRRSPSRRGCGRAARGPGPGGPAAAGPGPTGQKRTMPIWGGFSAAKQEQQTCRLAGLCGHSVKNHVSNISAPSYAEVRKNPMAAMQAVLKQCSGG